MLFLASYSLMWWDPIFMQGYCCLQYKHLTQAAYIASDNKLWAKIGADHAKLVASCHVSNLVKALHSFSDTPSDMWLHEHMIASYLFLCFYKLIWNYKIYFLQKFTFTEKSDFLQKFYTRSYTVWGPYYSTSYL